MISVLLTALVSQVDAGSVLDFCSVQPDPHVDGGRVIACTLPVYGARFAATEDQRDAGHILHRWSNGDTVTMPAFLVANSQNGMPSLATMPGKVNEMYGFTEYGDGGVYQRGAIEFYCFAPDGTGKARNGNSCISFGNYASSAKFAWWATDGDYTTTADKHVMLVDQNEAHFEARSAYGPAGTARLNLKGQIGNGSGPAVYMSPEKQAPANQPVFEVLNYYGSTGQSFMGNGALEVGRLEQAYFPFCDASREGTLLYNLTQHCQQICSGVPLAWACLRTSP